MFNIIYYYEGYWFKYVSTPTGFLGLGDGANPGVIILVLLVVVGAGFAYIRFFAK